MAGKDSAGILYCRLHQFLIGLQIHTRFNGISDIGILHILHQMGLFTIFEEESVLVSIIIPSLRCVNCLNETLNFNFLSWKI